MKDKFINDLPFYGSITEHLEIVENIIQLKEKVTKSSSPREIIFESWFIFDYYIRRMILSGLRIDDFENKQLDLMYNLLPQSFDSCLIFFEKFLINQKEIFEKKLHLNTYFKEFESDFSVNGDFFWYLNGEKKKLFDELCSEYFNFLKNNETEYYNAQIDWYEKNETIGKIVKISWIQKCTNINDQWFKQVRKLNQCRNKAAHLKNEEMIYESFGINGDKKLEKLKKEIIYLIKQTLNVEI